MPGALAEAPDLVMAWDALAPLLGSLDRREEAIEAGRMALSHKDRIAQAAFARQLGRGRDTAEQFEIGDLPEQAIAARPGFVYERRRAMSLAQLLDELCDRFWAHSKAGSTRSCERRAVVLVARPMILIGLLRAGGRSW